MLNEVILVQLHEIHHSLWHTQSSGLTWWECIFVAGKRCQEIRSLGLVWRTYIHYLPRFLFYCCFLIRVLSKTTEMARWSPNMTFAFHTTERDKENSAFSLSKRGFLGVSHDISTITILARIYSCSHIYLEERLRNVME